VWNLLLKSGNNQAMITLTGLTMEAFNWLNALLKPIYKGYSPRISPTGHIENFTKSCGHPQLMTSLDCLGLCLAWTRTKGPCYVFSMIFGITGTLVSMYNPFGRRILSTSSTKQASGN
jgi:hypothetical protein